MVILEAAIAVLLGLLFLIVTVPFRVRASASAHGDSLGASAEASWGFGFLALRFSTGRGLELRVLGARALRVSGRRKPESEDTAQPKPKSRTRPPIGAILGHRRALLRMTARVAHALRLRLLVKGRIGTGDPADMAVLVRLERLFEHLPGVDLDLEWNWIDQELDLDAEGSARIWIAHLLAVAAALLWIRENRALLRAMT